MGVMFILKWCFDWIVAYGSWCVTVCEVRTEVRDYYLTVLALSPV